MLADRSSLAAVLRFVDLPTRGTWDADQGHDMLVLRALVRDGVVPLLGPPTSIGDFHHGVALLLPARPGRRRSTGGDSPLAVVAAIALVGVAAVGVTWWLARSIGGPVAGLVAGLLMAVSASARRGVDVHLEPEPHRAVERDRPRGRVAGLDDAARPLVGRGRRRDRRDRCSATSSGVMLAAGRRGAAPRGCRGGAGRGRAVGRCCWSRPGGLAIVAAELRARSRSTS